MDAVNRMFDLIDSKYKEQREFADDIGVTASVVSQWRRRKSSSYTKYLPQIVEALETTTEYLLTGEGKRQKQDTSELEPIPFPSGLSRSGLLVAIAYDQADSGTQAAVRKLLDVEAAPQESGHTSEAM